MSDDESVDVPKAELRRILHRYNNLTARILTRAEVALMEPDASAHADALQLICESAEDLARFTRETRAGLLGDD